MSNPLPMAGKTCLITGATRGIGRVAAVELARQGADVVLVGRDPARAEAAAAEARAVASGGQVSTLVADLSLMSEVRRLAAAFKASHGRLDVLVNNAGAIFERREVTPEGFEKTFALNHLAYFLLTRELGELLVASAPARIVNVASRAHRAGRLDFADLQRTRGYTAWKAYAGSKLANILFTRELARRLAGTGVTANALHPGLVATNFGHDRFGLISLVLRFARPMMIGEAEGAATTLHLATSPAVADVTGAYFADCAATRLEPQALDDGAARRLWDETERLLGLAPAGLA